MMSLLLGVLGLGVGAWLPDVDLAPLGWGKWRLWAHRSIWTHGPLLATGLWWAGAWAGGWARPLLAGVLGGLALHLAADCLPRKWRGAALISLAPWHGRLHPVLSLLWIAAGVGVALVGAWRLW